MQILKYVMVMCKIRKWFMVWCAPYEIMDTCGKLGGHEKGELSKVHS